MDAETLSALLGIRTQLEKLNFVLENTLEEMQEARKERAALEEAQERQKIASLTADIANMLRWGIRR